MYLHSERGIQVSCRIEHPMIKIYNISTVDERERTELAQQQMETCKQIHIKLKPTRNKNQLSERKAKYGGNKECRRVFRVPLRNHKIHILDFEKKQKKNELRSILSEIE